MEKQILIGRADATPIYLNLNMLNRHGLIAGATGTGKTVTLQTIAHLLSDNGIPVFLSDIKGDLSGLAKAGGENKKVAERIALLDLVEFKYANVPVEFWDVFGEQGHPARCTVSDMGPVLLARMLNLNDTQEGVLNLIFKIADENELLLLDFKDLDRMLKFTSENSSELSKTYGRISAASVGAIQRALVAFESQGAEKLFGEPMLDIFDFIQTNTEGKGHVNILVADKLMQSPKVYAIFLLWLMSELFENLPEVGDKGKPKIVFFFDEAHLLFDEAPKALVEKIEQVARLIRSKGVGIFFVTQSPLDIPESVLGQLGNRVQHAMRAFTPKDQKAVRTIADTMRENSKFKTSEVITELGLGEALVSVLDESGVPTVVEKTMIAPPPSQIGPITQAERKSAIEKSLVYGHYEKVVDRESAYEKIEQASKQVQQQTQEEPEKTEQPGFWGNIFGSNNAPKGRGRPRQSVGEAMFKSAARTVGREIGRQFIRGILGSLGGGGRRR